VSRLTSYIEASMQHAEFEAVLDGASYYGTIPGMRGVWASAETREACAAELEQVLETWVLIGLQRGRALPPMGDVDLSGQPW
jgi:predicted RNase H-like HicB family nuclease